VIFSVCCSFSIH